MGILSASAIRRTLLSALLGLLITLGFAVSVASAFDVPANDGYVTDTVGLLTQDEKTSIVSVLKAYQDQTSNQIAVLIIDSLQGETIADVAVEVGRKWGVGTKENDNGILLLIAYTDRKVFLATGYGLEGAVPDIVAKGIIDEEITPRFREGKYAEGILACIEALQKHIGGEYTADRYVSKSSEGGGFAVFLFFLGIIAFQWLSAFLARTKSWWLGGVIGVVIGLVLTIALAWWWSIFLLGVAGLILDFVVSKNFRGQGRRRSRWWKGGGWGSGGSFGGGSSGGFGGFGGGSFGGGGAGGKW
ncbi:MAG: TPM domain-containing protein [Candidatus Peribacteraceae bacterium]|nr:TPM domain-containing protein [Candidatus Peribacteraceae bacterium]